MAKFECNIDFVKKIFIVIAYLIYVSSVYIKQNLNVNYGSYEYIIAAAVGFCIFCATQITNVQKIFTELDETKMNDMMTKLTDVHTSVVNLSGQRRLSNYIATTNNEPYNESNANNMATRDVTGITPRSEQPINQNIEDNDPQASHRTFRVDDRTVVRIHNS